MAFLLAQLSDMLTEEVAYALVIGGLLAPMAGWNVSKACYGRSLWKGTTVAIFYAVSLPLAGLVALGHTENPWAVLPFFLLLPVGILLGLIVLLPVSLEKLSVNQRIRRYAVCNCENVVVT